MTINPKAKKYRIRRSGTLSEPLNAEKRVQSPKTEAAGSPAEDMPFAQSEDGFGDQKFSTAAADSNAAQTAASESTPNEAEEEVRAAWEAIRAEGLTGRQLRMARRVAQKHGLSPENDLDAIRLLRAKGIDPFKRSTMLELVVPEGETPEIGKSQLPKTVDPNDKLPSTELIAEEVRAREIRKIQHDIARRRRRNIIMLGLRLAAFVFLPTFFVGVYYYNYATPLFATRSEFLVQKASAGGGGSLSSLFSGTGFANSQDSITVQSYLQSRDAMLRLDKDVGFKAHFSQDFIDPLRRLDPDSTNEQAYKLYKKMVKIGFDPTEGLVKMEVIAADPQTSALFSRALIAYAEEQVDNLTQRLREDQMKGARESYQEAETKMLAAQERVLELQEKLGIIDPVSETATLMGQIAAFETQIQEKGLQLQQLLDNNRPNQARVEGVRGDIKRLESLVAELRGQLTNSGSETASLARVSAELKMAQTNLETRTAMMQQALQQLETARIEANRQVRYLSLGVRPTPPDEATYPRKFENTVVALLIFSGIYLMFSLTASILREQVSA
jgi:capsular polysaccharide transport system permease protein